MRLIRFLTGSVGRVIRIVFSILGLLLVIAGIILCFTIVGIIIGIPLIVMGIVFISIGRFLAYKASRIGKTKEEKAAEDAQAAYYHAYREHARQQQAAKEHYAQAAAQEQHAAHQREAPQKRLAAKKTVIDADYEEVKDSDR